MRLDDIGLLLISGDEAAADPRVRELAERAEAVVAIAMFADVARGWTRLVLPGTSYLERDGTFVNLEGRPQRLRRAVIPPAPDELAWLAKLAERFEVELSPYAPNVFAELSPLLFGGIPFGEVGEFAELLPRSTTTETPAAPPAPKPVPTSHGGPLRLVRYRGLFSGPAVERVPELQFQRPEAEVELSARDAGVRRVADGDAVVVSSNGTSVELTARINAALIAGAVRIAHEHARELAGAVEVSRA
jgi:predicted molibdopterin-dependent oxidoreductase YjgC